jgi:hypothetical protein
MATLTTEREARIAAGLTPEPTTTEREDNALGFARMRRIVARFDGRCAGCRAGFAAGDEVAYQDWGHKRIEHLACLVGRFTPVARS